MKDSQRKALLTVPALFAGIVAYAAGDLEGLKNVLKGWLSNLVNFLMVLIGILALFQLARIIYLTMKGERDAAQQLFSWLFGLVGGAVVLKVVGELLMKL